MTPDDLVYASLLLISLPLSYSIRFLSSADHKRAFVALVGVVYVTLTCGYSSLHSLVTALVNYVIITKIKYRYSHVLSFIWCFGYLTFFRLCHLIGFPKSESCVNAIQLLLTLKMVGLAFELHDKCSLVCSNSGEKSIKGKTQHGLGTVGSGECVESDQTNILGKLQFFAYSYSFIGLLTGPYYKFQTFEDMIENDCNSYVSFSSAVMKRNKMLPIIIITFLFLVHHFNLEQVTTEWFYTEANVLQRLSFMVAMFTIFRTRLYIAWLLSESVCIACCLGAYPVESAPQCGQGPTLVYVYEEWKLKDKESKKKTDYNFETIKCIDLWGCELAPTIRQGMKSWNMTVQYWLATNIYKRTKSVKTNALRVTVTMMVSAYWHGVHPGYYLSFILIPFSLLAETVLSKTFSQSKWSTRSDCAKAFQVLCWFFKMRMFDYMCMGFLLLSLHNTLNYWRSIYFCGHVSILVVIVFGQIVSRLKRKHD